MFAHRVQEYIVILLLGALLTEMMLGQGCDMIRAVFIFPKVSQILEIRQW